jgi:hypothetical protein
VSVGTATVVFSEEQLKSKPVKVKNNCFRIAVILTTYESTRLRDEKKGTIVKLCLIVQLE